MTTDPYVPARGDFARMVLDPYTGREQAGERPVLVLSTHAFNLTTRHALVAPTTRRVRGWPFEVPIEPNDRVLGIVLVNQTRSVDYAARNASYLGQASATLVTTVCRRVSTILEDES